MTRKLTPNQPRKNTLRGDFVGGYAKAVGKGKITAGPHVRDACARHLKDIAEQAKRNIRWDAKAAQWAVGYFHDTLRLMGGQFEGVPFELLPWQQFIIGNLFGWKNATDGFRRFRVAYIETGKGSGKSPLLAGIGHYMLTADNEPRAEIYAAAVKRDQAMVLFRDAVAMMEQSADLTSALHASGGRGREWNLAYHATGSFFRPIGSDDRGIGQSGPRPHCALLDEIHEHPTNAMVEFMRAGTKSRRQALICMITNSGSNRLSPCFEYHQYGARVAAGEMQDDGFFSYICALDEKDDPFEDEACWAKANPSLPATPGYKYLREQVTEAKGLPSKEALVRRLNFCQWTDAENPLFTRDVWLSALHDLKLCDYAGRRCWAAIDLSGKADLTAMALAFEADNGGLDVFVEYWSPADTLAEREVKDRAPYTRWAREGYLIATPGKSIDYAWPATRIAECIEDYQLQALGFDRYRIDDLERELDELGVEHCRPEDKHGHGLLMLQHGQGYKDMAPAIDEMEERVLNGRIRIHRNPVSTMCAANAIIDADAAENRKFNKAKASGRIDGMVAIAMVIRIASMKEAERVNIYDQVELA